MSGHRSSHSGLALHFMLRLSATVKGAEDMSLHIFCFSLVLCTPSCASLYTVVHTHLLPIAAGWGNDGARFGLFRRAVCGCHLNAQARPSRSLQHGALFGRQYRLWNPLQ